MKSAETNRSKAAGSGKRSRCGACSLRSRRPFPPVSSIARDEPAFRAGRLKHADSDLRYRHDAQGAKLVSHSEQAEHSHCFTPGGDSPATCKLLQISGNSANHWKSLLFRARERFSARRRPTPRDSVESLARSLLFQGSGDDDSFRTAGRVPATADGYRQWKQLKSPRPFEAHLSLTLALFRDYSDASPQRGCSLRKGSARQICFRSGSHARPAGSSTFVRRLLRQPSPVTRSFRV